MEDAKSSLSLPHSSSVSIISKSSVYPDRPSDLGRLNLSVFDLRLLFVHYIQRGLLFTPPIFASSDLINHLRSSLSRALSFYPPLAGRLSTNPDHGSLFVVSNDAGVDFVHAAAPGLSLADVAVCNPDVPDVVKELFPLNGVDGFDGLCSAPVTAVQVTELADGVFVGCSINHAVADGASFWDFINSWSELCRGVGKISRPPNFRRDFLHDPLPVPRDPAVGRAMFRSTAAPTRDRVFHFSGRAVQDLKARANLMAGTNEREISSFQALCSQLWWSVTRARKLSPGTETLFRMAVDCRHRMDPPLATHYFGNAILHILAVGKAEEVVGRGMGWCAQRLHRNVAAFGDEMVRNEVENWKERKPRKLGTDGAVLGVSSSPRFAVYENDMGWGRPVAALSGAANKVDGAVSALPGREGGGSINLEVCLAPETMARLESDEEFMQYVAGVSSSV